MPASSDIGALFAANHPMSHFPVDLALWVNRPARDGRRVLSVGSTGGIRVGDFAFIDYHSPLSSTKKHLIPICPNAIGIRQWTISNV
jgi:hypothetical protein